VDNKSPFFVIGTFEVNEVWRVFSAFQDFSTLNQGMFSKVIHDYVHPAVFIGFSCDCLYQTLYFEPTFKEN
jgi:hypothetical protein